MKHVTVSATEAKRQLGSFLMANEVEIIEKNGEPVKVLVPVSEYRILLQNFRIQSAMNAQQEMIKYQQNPSTFELTSLEDVEKELFSNDSE